MHDHTKASLESQLKQSTCEIEDTEKMFWLRESDDYASRVALGDALAGQYRYWEAIEIYEKALRIRQDDVNLYAKLGGASLTLFRFEDAKIYYEKCLSLGMAHKSLSYPLGILAYMKEAYQEAADLFLEGLPCDDEMKIAIIYWHTLSAYRASLDTDTLQYFDADMKIQYHTAYKLAVEVFRGEQSVESALTEILNYSSELDYVIAMYGICGYFYHTNQYEQMIKYRKMLLEKKEIWPCVSYLVAYYEDSKKEKFHV